MSVTGDGLLRESVKIQSLYGSFTKRDFIEIAVSTGSGRVCVCGGGGGGEMSLEPRVKFPYINESRDFLEPLLVTMNT